MMLRPWESLPRFADLTREMDRLFGGLFLPTASSFRALPPMNVYQEGDDLIAEAEVPGFTADEIDVTVEGPRLTVRGTKRHEDEEETAKDAVSHRVERGTSSFSRSLRLPVRIDSERVEAKLLNGILTLRLPKAAEEKSRRITVNAN